MVGIKDLVQKARDECHLVEKSPFRGEIDDDEVIRVREKLDLLDRLSGYSRSRDIYADFSVEAAKQLVIESKFGKSSSDRTKAADSILDRAEGKAVNRQLSMTVTPSDMGDAELVSRVMQLAGQLGIAKDVDGSKLILGRSEEVRAAAEESSGFERGEGPESIEEPSSDSGNVAGEV